MKLNSVPHCLRGEGGGGVGAAAGVCAGTADTPVRRRITARVVGYVSRIIF
jgi:hypothetical protein